MQMWSIYRSFRATIHSMSLLIWKLVHKQRNSTSNKLSKLYVWCWVELSLSQPHCNRTGEAPGDNARGFWEESIKKWTSLGFDEISRKKLTCADAGGRVYGNYDRKKKTKQNKIENNEQPIIPPLAPGSPMNYRAPEGESPSFWRQFSACDEYFRLQRTCSLGAKRFVLVHVGHTSVHQLIVCQAFRLFQYLRNFKQATIFGFLDELSRRSVLYIDLGLFPAILSIFRPAPDLEWNTFY